MPYAEEEKAILLKIGRNIRAKRKALSLSQEELAFRAELDRTYVGSVERGERNIAVLNLVRIAGVLGVEPGYLLKSDKS